MNERVPAADAAAATDAPPCAPLAPVAPVAPPAAAADPARVSSAQLFGAAREVLIEHRGALYRLKQTSLGKLILTK